MSKRKSRIAGLAALYGRVCGLDVHKKLVVANLWVFIGLSYKCNFESLYEVPYRCVGGID